MLPVAEGDVEAPWVERAASETVRALEAAVRRARADAAADVEDEPWLVLRTHVPSEERTVIDLALELAGDVMPAGSSRADQLEALAQEYLGELSTDADGDAARPLGASFRGDARERVGRERRRAAVEVETDRWAALAPTAPVPTPDVVFSDETTAEEVDRAVRELARLRAGWGDVIGYCAHALRRTGVHRLLGFADFRQYVEERLQLPPRAVEQRAALEARPWASPALQEARRQRMPYEKLRVLARLPEGDVRSWIPCAKAMTCIALRRAIDGERERQMRARQKIVIPLPRRVAVLLAAAVEVVRERVGRTIATGSCLAVLAAHFIRHWKHSTRRDASRSRQVRARDEGFCQVPGCSHRADHAHHVLFRSRGGSDDVDNQVALCAFHHFRCVHGGYLSVVGRAPDGLTWVLNGAPWSGPGSASAVAPALAA